MYTSVGIDLDGVLYDYYSLIRKHFPTLPEECDTLDTMDALNLEERQQYHQFTRSPYMIKELTMYEGAMDFVTWTNSKFKSMYIITARHIATETATRKQVKAWNLPITNVIMEQDKQKVVPDMVSIYLEDSPRQLHNLKKFKYLKLLVPMRKYNKKWIQDNIADYSVYPYSSFEQAKEIISHLLEETNDVA
jgi:hypothetical protein